MNITNDTDDQTAIQQQCKRLAAHRERLAILLAQYAHFGAHVPPHVLTDIREAQAALRPIKAWLRAKGISIADEPNDDVQVGIAATPSDQPDQSPNQTINNLAPNQGAKGNFYGPVSILSSSGNDSTIPKQGITTSEAQKLQNLMPKLIQEMSIDLKHKPTIREFFIASRRWLVNSRDPHFIYYFEDHDDIQGKIHILENYGLVHDVTPKGVKKYRFTEKFVDFLLSIEA